MKKTFKYYLSLVVITALVFTGCSSGSKQAQNGTENTVSVESADTTDSAGTDTNETDTSGTDGAAAATTLPTASQVAVDKEFTARDLDVGYEDSTAAHITFDGTSAQVDGEGAVWKENILTISKEGTYVLAGTLTDGQVIVAVKDTEKVQLVLNGVSITCSDNAPIYIKSADKVFITLEENSENTLTDGKEYVQTDENNVDGVIYSKADLTVIGDGKLTISGNYKHGIASKDDLIITGGTYNITAVKDALNGKDCVKIKDGTFTLTASTGNGIQSKNGEDTTKGYVYICGGDIQIVNCREGIEGTAIVVDGGNIKIKAEDDGLNSASGSSDTEETSTDGTSTDGTSTDGTSTDGASTDGASTKGTPIDAASSATENVTSDSRSQMDGFPKGGSGGGGNHAFEVDTNCYISINGGTITIDAAGDGIDSNGSIYVAGGTTYVNGPIDNGNAAFDYNGTAEITGGTFLALGSAGMAQGFSDSSTQYSILNNFTAVSAAGTELKLTDKDGKEIIAYTPSKEYQSVVISSPDLAKNQTYTITSGEQTADLTLASVVTSNGGQGGMGGRGGGQRKRPDWNGQDRMQPPKDAGTKDSTEADGSNNQ